MSAPAKWWSRFRGVARFGVFFSEDFEVEAEGFGVAGGFVDSDRVYAQSEALTCIQTIVSQLPDIFVYHGVVSSSRCCVG